MNEEQGITPQKPMGHQQPCKTKPDLVGGERGWEQKEREEDDGGRRGAGGEILRNSCGGEK